MRPRLQQSALGAQHTERISTPIDRFGLTHLAFLPEPLWRKSLVRTNLHTHTMQHGTAHAVPPTHRPTASRRRGSSALSTRRACAKSDPALDPSAHPPRAPVRPRLPAANSLGHHCTRRQLVSSGFRLTAVVQQRVPIAPLQRWWAAEVVCCALRRCIPVACSRHARGRRACSTTLLSTAVQMPTLRGVPHAPCPTFTRHTGTHWRADGRHARDSPTGHRRGTAQPSAGLYGPEGLSSSQVRVAQRPRLAHGPNVGDVLR